MSAFRLLRLPFGPKASVPASPIELRLPFNVRPSSARLALQFQLCLVTLGLRAAP